MSESTTTSNSTAVESPCPECGEMVRRGLVRCWNCGAFMDASVQARYQELQKNPPPPIFSEVPDEEIHSIEDDDGFQLSMPDSGKTDLSELDSVDQEDESPKTEKPEDSAVAHSVATGGDVLLQAALLEEAENKLRRRKRPAYTGGAKTATGFIVFCPYGCRIEVKESHRGMNGKCPKCRAPFFVPVDPPDYSVATKKKDAEPEAAADVGYADWIDDMHVHTVPPEKLKLKADSLTKEFAEADIGIGKQGLLIAFLSAKAKGRFGGGKKKEEVREELRTHLQDGKPNTELPVGDHQLIEPDDLAKIRVVQPTASRTDSMFHGIPVFGEGRIAVQLPLPDEDDATPRFISMGITEFRKLAKALAEYADVHLGTDNSIPLEDEFEEAGKCHFLSTPVRSLKHLEFYRADPKVEVVLSGWKCAACGMIVSEDARQKEKLGGKGGKGIAKVKCPKCKQKMGEQPMYTLKEAADGPSMSGEEPAEDNA